MKIKMNAYCFDSAAILLIKVTKRHNANEIPISNRLVKDSIVSFNVTKRHNANEIPISNRLVKNSIV